jgi:hypothetical protein
MDSLTRDRMEVDMMQLTGPAFQGVDTRLVSLQLVEQRLTNAAMFAPGGAVVEPAELLWQKPVLLQRGSFRPVTRVAVDMLARAEERMRAEPDMEGQEPIVLMEMTLRNLLTLGEQVDHADFLARMDTLAALGRTVMVSNYSRFHNLTGYLRRYTKERIGMALGVPTLAQILDERHYADLEGGILETMGRLLAGKAALYVYPWQASSGEEVTAESFRPPHGVRHLYRHLLDRRLVQSISASPGAALGSMPSDALARLQAGDLSWMSLVPKPVVAVIRERGLFGLPQGTAGPSPTDTVR